MYCPSELGYSLACELTHLIHQPEWKSPMQRIKGVYKSSTYEILRYL
jgi:hypothetical protein